jgi:hypothetical protein
MRTWSGLIWFRTLINHVIFGRCIYSILLFTDCLALPLVSKINRVELVHGMYGINPLNAELNPICPLLILLGDLKFMGPCIVSIFQYISNKMQRYTVYLYLETALHVSGGTSTHHQERIHLYLQHLVFVTPLLLSAAIVEELEPV